MIVFETACELCKKKWNQTMPLSVHSIKKIDKEQQIKNLQHLRTHADQLQQLYENNDRIGMDECLQSWMKQDAVWDLSWLQEDEREDFYSISKQFMADARAFDPEMLFEDIGQAIRNVWIMLILMKVFHRKLRYHKAIFAYSMLYPYTDNYLDSNDICKQDKETFNTWLYQRLRGKVLHAEKTEYKNVDAMISMIEEVYPRNEFPQVYDALLRIQDGQVKSIHQNHVTDDEILLAISVEKGGASVYADGFLIDGNMNDQEAIFTVAFGFLLQLADDIQDVDEDIKQQHHTLITNKKRKSEKAVFCRKYLRFIEVIIYELCPNKDMKLKTFMIENCRSLILFSLVKNASYYTKLFLYRIQHRLPLHANDMKNLCNDMDQIDLHDQSFLSRFDEFLERV